MQFCLLLIILNLELLLDLTEIEADLFQIELELIIRVLDLVHSLFQVGQGVFLLDVVVAAQFLNPVHQGQRRESPDSRPLHLVHRRRLGAHLVHLLANEVGHLLEQLLKRLLDAPLERLLILALRQKLILVLEEDLAEDFILARSELLLVNLGIVVRGVTRLKWFESSKPWRERCILVV